MLRKLEDKQAEESKHAAWCDSEMGKTTKQLKKKGDDVQKTNDRLEALLADLAESKSDINDVTKDLKEMTASMTAAKTLRAKESKNAQAALREYKNAGALLQR